MNDPLHDLLKEADGSVPPPRRIDDLASAARRTAGNRQKVRTVTSAAAVLLLFSIAATLTFISTGHRHQQLAGNIPLTPQQIEKVRRDLADLDQQARWHERLAERIAARQAQNRAPAHHTVAADPARMRRDLDEAAFSIIYQAQRLANQPDLQRAAADFYREVIVDFPDSSWAPVARERLARLKL